MAAHNWVLTAFSLVPRKTLMRRCCLIHLNNGATYCHQHRPDEVTIHYRFHPLCTHKLPVIRRYERYSETFYVVRRADGRPLAVPDWMTHPEVANVKFVSTVRLPGKVLLGLCNAAVTIPSSAVHNMHEENQDANGQDETTTPTFRGTSSRSRRTTPAGGNRPASPDIEAVDAGASQRNLQRGRR